MLPQHVGRYSIEKKFHISFVFCFRSRERARMGLGTKTSFSADKDEDEVATASYKLSGTDKVISNGKLLLL